MVILIHKYWAHIKKLFRFVCMRQGFINGCYYDYMANVPITGLFHQHGSVPQK